MDREYWTNVLTEAQDKGMSMYDVAEQEHYAPNSVARFARALNIRLVRKKRVYWVSVMEYAKKTHMTITQVAEAEQVTHSDVLYWEKMTGIRLRRVRQNNLPRPVLQLTLGSVEVARFRNATAASRETGISQGSISCCCNGITKTAGGFRWRYE